MIQKYKILTNKYDPEVCDFVPLIDNPNYNIKGNSLKIIKRLNKSVDIWNLNSLSTEVVCAATVKAFEARLDWLWCNKDIKFNFNATF